MCRYSKCYVENLKTQYVIDKNTEDFEEIALSGLMSVFTVCYSGKHIVSQRL